MKKNIVIVLLVMILLNFSCSPKTGGGLTMESYQSSHGLAYDDSDSYSTTRWEGVGFNLEAPIAAAAPAYKDMSNLYERARGTDNSDPEDSISADLSNVERKLVKRANIRIRVEKLEAADASVADLIAKYGAYAASTNIEENAYYYSLRVPSQFYDIFISEMNGLGRLLRRSESTEDVTLRYYDLEGRLATKRELLRTFQSYLGRARNIEEILSVEARIAELQSDIEGTGKQLRNLANSVDYATIDLNILGPLASLSGKYPTLSERIKRTFSSFGRFLSSIAIIIVGIVIYGIPILLLVALLLWLFFGRIGLAKRLWLLIMGKKQRT